MGWTVRPSEPWRDPRSPSPPLPGQPCNRGSPPPEPNPLHPQWQGNSTAPVSRCGKAWGCGGLRGDAPGQVWIVRRCPGRVATSQRGDCRAGKGTRAARRAKTSDGSGQDGGPKRWLGRREIQGQASPSCPLTSVVPHRWLTLPPFCRPQEPGHLGRVPRRAPPGAPRGSGPHGHRAQVHHRPHLQRTHLHF